MIDPRGNRRRPSRWDRALVIGVLALTVLALFTLGVEIGRRLDGGDDAPTPTAAPSPTATVATAATPVAPPPASPGAAGDLVCLDPGHGGLDLGNVRLDGDEILLQEKDFTLAHSLELADRLRAKGIGVVLTRTTDAEANPTNQDVNGDGVVAPPDARANSDELDDQQARVNICNAAGADLLVSVHYNGAENEFLEGYEVWLNGERPFSDQSLRFAELIHAELGARLRAAGLDATDRGIGYEDHAVTGPERPGKLVPSAMPGVVVEGLFLSNEQDAAFVVTDAAREAIVGAYEAAILGYFGVPPL